MKINVTNNDPIMPTSTINTTTVSLDDTDPEHIIVTGKQPNGDFFDLHFDSCGRYHNPVENVPAYITKGFIVYIFYSENSDTLNINYYYRGNTDCPHISMWYKHGKEHNTKGHAYYHDSRYGVVKELYYVNGKLLSKIGFTKKYLPDQWRDKEMQKKIYILGKKYRIKSIVNSNVILEEV